MRARWAAWAAWALAWCACAAAAPADPRLSPSAAPAAPAELSTPSPAPATPATAPSCNPLLLRHQPPLPSNVREYEAATVHTARALAELVELGAADETRAAALARAAARAPLSPPPAAVALGAPQLRLGVLYMAEPPRLVVFQQNNSVALRQFWRTLASAWNATTVLWSSAWFSCDSDDLGWWGGAAAARGAGPSRAAAAIFRRWPTLPCEEAMHEWLGGPPLCEPATSLCEALPADESSPTKLEYRCKCRDSHWHESGSSWVSGAELRAEGAVLACRPCGVGSDAAACLADVYRAALLAANLAGMLICLIIGLIIFKKRKCKAVAMGMWTVLEVVLLGALLIYASAASQYISEARWRCVAGAWLRELGFVACYGSVVLRLWVLLAEFRTRKAHRWTPRDSEVLRVVGAMMCGAGCYLAAFTATSACGDGEGCARAAWHNVTAAAELLLLAAGARIAYAARNANVPFQGGCQRRCAARECAWWGGARAQRGGWRRSGRRWPRWRARTCRPARRWPACWRPGSGTATGHARWRKRCPAAGRPRASAWRAKRRRLRRRCARSSSGCTCSSRSCATRPSARTTRTSASGAAGASRPTGGSHCRKRAVAKRHCKRGEAAKARAEAAQAWWRRAKQATCRARPRTPCARPRAPRTTPTATRRPEPRGPRGPIIFIHWTVSKRNVSEVQILRSAKLQAKVTHWRKNQDK